MSMLANSLSQQEMLGSEIVLGAQQPHHLHSGDFGLCIVTLLCTKSALSAKIPVVHHSHQISVISTGLHQRSGSPWIHHPFLWKQRGGGEKDYDWRG